MNRYIVGKVLSVPSFVKRHTQRYSQYMEIRQEMFKAKGIGKVVCMRLGKWIKMELHTTMVWFKIQNELGSFVLTLIIQCFYRNSMVLAKAVTFEYCLYSGSSNSSTSAFFFPGHQDGRRRADNQNPQGIRRGAWHKWRRCKDVLLRRKARR